MRKIERLAIEVLVDDPRDGGAGPHRVLPEASAPHETILGNTRDHEW